jgi:hypothetical protein
MESQVTQNVEFGKKSCFNELFKPESYKMDIDLIFYKYGILYKHDINNYFKNDSNKRRQKFKTWTLSVWLVFNIIRFSLYLYYSKNGRLPLYYFDIIQNFGGITVYSYTASLSATILSLRILTLFNNSNKSYFKWFEVINTLKEIEINDSLPFSGPKEFGSFTRRVKILKILIFYSFKFLDYALILASITVLINFYQFEDIIKYGIIASIIYWFWYHWICALTTYSILTFYIICEFCRIKFKLLNNKISEILSFEFIRLSAVDEILEEHNHICETIFLYNRFWKKFYFGLTYTLIVFSLLILQLILFEKILPILYFLILFSLLSAFLLLQIFSLITASVYKKSRESHKLIFKLLIEMDSILDTRRKIKV